MAMCFSRPQPAMICCHSPIERPYFFSIDGKYEAGPCFGHGGACSTMLTCSSRPRGSAHLNDIGADDDTVMNRIRALIGVDGAVGLLCAEAGRDYITRDRQDGQRVSGGAGESADEAGVGPAGVPAAEAPGPGVAVAVDSSYVRAHSVRWAHRLRRRGEGVRGESGPAGLRQDCPAPPRVRYCMVGGRWRAACGVRRAGEELIP